jgi:hypothetical protein
VGDGVGDFKREVLCTVLKERRNCELKEGIFWLKVSESMVNARE